MSDRIRISPLALALVAVTVLLTPVQHLLAQDVVQPDVSNSRFQFTGSINSADVYVRSGPGDAYYTTSKLAQGAPVTVVGIKYDWLKVLPPDDSFCYISKLYVDRSGNGSVGRVNRAGVNIRAGSLTSAMKTTVLGKLNEGENVKILGEQDEYYKIAPPVGTYLYVNKQFVDPVHPLAKNVAPIGDAVGMPAAEPTQMALEVSPSTQPSGTLAGNLPPTTQPDAAVAQIPAAPAGPSPAEIAQQQFVSAESDFAAASAKPLEQQPIAAMTKEYEPLSQSKDISAADRQTAGFRLAILKVRLDAQQRLADVTKMEADSTQHNQALKAEQDELQKRLDANAVKLYAAVGQLQPSSLQYGSNTLYRLTDPATGRTVIYVRGDNAEAVKYIGQFVGVRGDATTDDRLNIQVIPFSVIEAVDPNQVNNKVISGIIPPSMTGKAIQASSGN